MDRSFDKREPEAAGTPVRPPQQPGSGQGGGYGSGAWGGAGHGAGHGWPGAWGGPGQGAWGGSGHGSWGGPWGGHWHGSWPHGYWHQPWWWLGPWQWNWPWYWIMPYGAQSPGLGQPFTRSGGNELTEWKDYGGQPFVVDIEDAAERNPFFRMALWTGSHLQVTLMSIGVGGEIGLEIHPGTDQFLRIEQGRGVVKMGDSRDRLDYVRNVSADDAIMIPAGKWHNVINVGHEPLKLYSIYAPPEHPFGTVHRTKAEAEAAHRMR